MENIAAFPRTESVDKDGFGRESGQEGMDLLDYFAGQALPSVIAIKGATLYQLSHNYDGVADDIADATYSIATAMLRSRARQAKI